MSVSKEKIILNGNIRKGGDLYVEAFKILNVFHVRTIAIGIAPNSFRIWFNCVCYLLCLEKDKYSLQRTKKNEAYRIRKRRKKGHYRIQNDEFAEDFGEF